VVGRRELVDTFPAQGSSEAGSNALSNFLFKWSRRDPRSTTCAFSRCKLMPISAFPRHLHSTEAITGDSTLLKAESCQVFLSCEDLHAPLAAILPRHGSLKRLHDRAGNAPVIGELFRTVVDGNAYGFTPKLVIRSLIDILKASPSLCNQPMTSRKFVAIVAFEVSFDVECRRLWSVGTRHGAIPTAPFTKPA
jgi:hypothetical protein